MATIKRRSDRGNRWEVRYRDPEGKQRARLFDRKTDAERFAATTLADIVRGAYIAPEAGRQTFGEYAARWQTLQVHRESTGQQVAGHLRNHILPAFGDRSLAAIRKSEVQAFVKDRAQVIGPKTLQVVMRHTVAIFRAAVADQRIARNPAEGVKLPKAAALEVVPPTTEQVEALIQATPARYRALVVLTAGTGLRQGEAFGVAIDRIDFLRRTLRVDRQVLLIGGQKPKLGPPKTEASYRTIPLPSVVIDALAAHLAAYPVTHEHGLVFTNAAGGALSRSSFNHSVWQKAREAAGLPVGTTFHDLRHYYASLLIRHGESVKVVQKRLGHSTAGQTLDTYGHLWPDSDDQTRAAVDLVLGAIRCAPDVHYQGASAE